MSPPSPAKPARPASPSGREDGLPDTYEEALAELERLVAQLDAGQLPLDQLLVQYQRGARLLAFCRERLEAVEQQIRVLEGGEARPWDPA
ncbi:MAG TPA: exodeoxyribonuclease VII small subunit [Hydrogenophaga sp.]|uniref:exodeoxyribonuclease VII small subunit n=1 Tax=Hydrogenophaga sp. TaxID=1904254 RepID=UPI002BECDA77|nr:exodeoxyribonuclease VII small subunit [Hydrogenophaga sp.]HMN94664.1 exodeoxyribonuclease VII small subunit [Hydrogenophaga sp.]HMP12059.1 exodeoxyribonuclease VII small subunit [Hydrogenophaga sp.]